MHHGGPPVPTSAGLGAHAQLVDNVGAIFAANTQLNELYVAARQERLGPVRTALGNMSVSQTYDVPSPWMMLKNYLN